MPRNTSFFPQSAPAIALVAGLVGWSAMIAAISLKELDQSRPVVLGAGTLSALVGVCVGGGAWVGSRLQQKRDQQARLGGMHVQNSDYRSVAQPLCLPPSTQESLPSFGYQPTGKGQMFYIEPIAGVSAIASPVDEQFSVPVGGEVQADDIRPAFREIREELEKISAHQGGAGREATGSKVIASQPLVQSASDFAAWDTPTTEEDELVFPVQDELSSLFDYSLGSSRGNGHG